MKKIISDALSNIKQVVREVIREESTRFAKWFKEMLADEEKYLSPEETAKILDISPSTLYRRTKEKIIPAYGIKGLNKTYYKMSDIKAEMIRIN